MPTEKPMMYEANDGSNMMFMLTTALTRKNTDTAKAILYAAESDENLNMVIL